MATFSSSMFVKLEGVKEAVAALGHLTQKVRIKHMRIALMAAGGVLKKRIEATAPKDTGLLKKSIRVKPIIPQASKNPAHHDKPASVFIGPGKGLVAVRTIRKSGKLGALSIRTYKSVKAKLDAAKAAGKTKPLAIVMSARQIKGQRINVPVSASRYAHFPEKGREGKGAQHYMARAAQSGAAEANAKFAAKIGQGIKQEAARLASKPTRK